MENSELIENYFTSSLSPDQVRAFEKRIESEPAFAEEVAFYLSVHTVTRVIGQSEKKEYFRELYQNSQSATTPVMPIYTLPGFKKSQTIPIRKLVYYLATAAVVAGIIFGVYTQVKPDSPQQMAAKYEKENLMNLPVTMGPRDSLQTGIELYNKRKFELALVLFEQMSPQNSAYFRARKYAGFSALRLKDYDKAMIYFRQLEGYTQAFSNPALFFEALTLVDRNQPGDADSAKQLLQQVVAKDLDEKETAVEWLGKWKK